MSDITFSIGTLICDVSYDRITLTTNYTSFVICAIKPIFTANRSKQEIMKTERLILFGSDIAQFSRHIYKFSDVYRIAKTRTDRNHTEILESRVEQFQSYDYDLLMYLKSGKKVKIASAQRRFEPDLILPISLSGLADLYTNENRRTILNSPVSGFVVLETSLQEMMELPDEY